MPTLQFSHVPALKVLAFLADVRTYCIRKVSQLHGDGKSDSSDEKHSHYLTIVVLSISQFWGGLPVLQGWRVIGMQSLAAG